MNLIKKNWFNFWDFILGFFVFQNCCELSCDSDIQIEEVIPKKNSCFSEALSRIDAGK